MSNRNENSNSMIDPSFQKIKDRAIPYNEVEAAAAAIAATNTRTGNQQAFSGLPPAPQSPSKPKEELSNSGADIEPSPALDEKGNPFLHHGKPLTNTKRAAQNRSAQKAFRQRRKDYIEELEKKLSTHKDCEQTISSLKTENEQLKQYIMSLQGKLLQSTGATSAQEIPGSISSSSPPLNLFTTGTSTSSGN